MSVDIATPTQDGFIGLLFGFPNELAGGLLGIFMTLGVFALVFFGASRSGDIDKAFLAAAFISLGWGVFMMVFKILQWEAFLALAFLYIIGISIVG